MYNTILIINLFIGFVSSNYHCEDVPVDKEYWKNEGAAIIYMMKSSQQNWQGQVSELLHLQKNLKKLGVNLQLTVATNKNCTAYHTVNEFRIDGGKIWNTLDHHNDYPEAYVIDRCGKMTYHLIFPWSLHKFPFIKGAILSTFFDKPCGHCDMFHSYHIEPPKEFSENNEIKIYPKLERESSETISDESAPPIDIIIKDRHRHEGSNEIFEYTELELGNTNHHKHFHTLDDLEFIQYEDNTDGDKTVVNQIYGKNQRKIGNNQHNSRVTKRFISNNDDDNQSSSIETQKSTLNNKLKEIAMVCGEHDPTYMERLYRYLSTAINTSSEELSSVETKKKEDIARHYEKLKNWISYIV